MKTKKSQSKELTLQRQGTVPVETVNQTLHDVFSEISQGKEIESQLHTSKNETLFVFMVNGICATLHIQAFKPQRKGGMA